MTRLKSERLEVLTALSNNSQVFWAVASCRLVNRYWVFEGVRYLHFQSPRIVQTADIGKRKKYAHSKRRYLSTRWHGVTSQRAWLFKGEIHFSNLERRNRPGQKNLSSDLYRATCQTDLRPRGKDVRYEVLSASVKITGVLDGDAV
jgi:hypothetical protein